MESEKKWNSTQANEECKSGPSKDLTLPIFSKEITWHFHLPNEMGLNSLKGEKEKKEYFYTTRISIIENCKLILLEHIYLNDFRSIKIFKVVPLSQIYYLLQFLPISLLTCHTWQLTKLTVFVGHAYMEIFMHDDRIANFQWKPM